MRLVCLLLLAGTLVSSGLGQEPPSATAPSVEPAKKLRVVVFGAHCDDNELGAGGLMRLLTDQGHEVISAYATAFRRGRMIAGQPEATVRQGESTAACQLLGATPHFFPFAHEELEKPFAERNTLVTIVAWLHEIQPDIVVAHWPLDTHPNHQVVGASTWMAYQHSGPGAAPASPDGKTAKSWNLYYYEVNTFTSFEELQTLGFRPNSYVDISRVREAKHQAIDCLKSQNPQVLWGIHDNMHQKRGAECGVPYAEAFFLVEAKPGCPTLPLPIIAK
jgi:N-acetylglucosamine malate deacetylase 1